jgi:hypothetical protein
VSMVQQAWPQHQHARNSSGADARSQVEKLVGNRDKYQVGLTTGDLVDICHGMQLKGSADNSRLLGSASLSQASGEHLDIRVLAVFEVDITEPAQQRRPFGAKHLEEFARTCCIASNIAPVQD